jgi:hypothetical protein
MNTQLSIPAPRRRCYSCSKTPAKLRLLRVVYTINVYAKTKRRVVTACSLYHTSVQWLPYEEDKRGRRGRVPGFRVPHPSPESGERLK